MLLAPVPMSTLAARAGRLHPAPVLLLLLAPVPMSTLAARAGRLHPAPVLLLLLLLLALAPRSTLETRVRPGHWARRSHPVPLPPLALLAPAPMSIREARVRPGHWARRSNPKQDRFVHPSFDRYLLSNSPLPGHLPQKMHWPRPCPAFEPRHLEKSFCPPARPQAALRFAAAHWLAPACLRSVPTRRPQLENWS